MTQLAIHDQVPSFTLPDTKGQVQSLDGTRGAPATVVIFTCNHCPYALAWHDRLSAVADDYANQGVRSFAINSNDAERYPADSFEKMQQRTENEAWPMPYLHDENQAVAASWGAKTTPDIFVLDSEHRLRYRGAPDSDYDDPKQNAAWLREALDSLLAGNEITRAETEPVGCSIKWK